MNENISGLILILSLGVIYFHWIRFELKQQFVEQLKEVEEKLRTAAQAVGAESHGSKARIHFREANSLMQEIKEFDWAKGDLDDLIAVRQQLYIVNYQADCAITATRKKDAKAPQDKHFRIFA
ncbi:MAG: hypothetical protein HYX67_06940 [Candidatus Melainabacteria bacterium]|nr:hypothetical protein [Candidatus Melainabacteria bacterium]